MYFGDASTMRGPAAASEHASLRLRCEDSPTAGGKRAFRHPAENAQTAANAVALPTAATSVIGLTAG
jgi:hypothetical protein